MEHFRPGCAASVTASTVEVSVAARDLMDMDTFSKSDPMCVLFCRDDFSGKNAWFEFGRTEIIWNNLNPDFVKKFHLSYFFEERQHLRFELYDVDANSPNLAKHDFLGRIECTLGEIVSSTKLVRNLTGLNITRGSIQVSAEELSTCKEEVTMQFAGKKLDKKDWFGKSDPYLAFYKVNEDGTYTVCHRTEFIKNTLNPTWKQFTVPVRALCGGDYNRSILVKCFDWNRDGTEDLIGEFTTNLADLSQGPSTLNTWELVKKPTDTGSWFGGGSKKKVCGQVALLKFAKQKSHTFLDFIQTGLHFRKALIASLEAVRQPTAKLAIKASHLRHRRPKSQDRNDLKTQLNCTIAIDFTASNGNPTQSNSLHYIHPNQPNQYARALQAVGEIIQDYDTDKLFPVLGFGARLPPDGRVSHEFFVNGITSNPFCNGIQGVLEAYHRCLMQIQLYGPTNFAPVINHVARFAAAKRDGSEYFILLILTDGVITDMPQTKEAIVQASCLPLSIIIVGVGQADFDAMHELDGDDEGEYGRLSSRGRKAERDIVQFVPFRDFIRGNTSMDHQVSQARLAKEVLEEIPDQFLSYMRANNVTPGSWRPPGQRHSLGTPTAPTAPTPHERGTGNFAVPAGNGRSDAPPPYPGF